MAVLELWLAVSCAAFALQELPDGTLTDRSDYAFPFATHDAWVKEMAGKGIEDWSVVFGKAEYDRFHSGTSVRVERITYESDGLAIKGFLVTPKNRKTPAPLVVFNRGGTLEWSRITFWEILEFCRLAERGYVVVASYFRGCGGSEGVDELGSGDVRDVLNAIKMAESLPLVDTARIGVWGFSRGAVTSYHLLAKEPRIKAAVMVGGVSDASRSHRYQEFDEHVYPKALPGYTQNKEAALRSISPLLWAETLNPNVPILLMHGGADWRVLPEQSLAMATKLQELGRSYRLVIFEGGSHSLLEHVAAFRAQLDDWLDRYVREGQVAPKNKPISPNPQ